MCLSYLQTDEPNYFLEHFAIWAFRAASGPYVTIFEPFGINQFQNFKMRKMIWFICWPLGAKRFSPALISQKREMCSNVSHDRLEYLALKNSWKFDKCDFLHFCEKEKNAKLSFWCMWFACPLLKSQIGQHGMKKFRSLIWELIK